MGMFKTSKGIEHTLKVRAPAKINLHLEVLGLRSDGFHELAMFMQSIDLVDHLEIKKTENRLVSLCSDSPSLSNSDDNLIVKAANLLKRRSGNNDLGADIYLKKRIPIGAGLAGGSSDGAAALIGLNAIWGLGLSTKELEILACDLGSDVPFCLVGGSQFCFGRGEILEPVDMSDIFKSMAVVLVKDPFVSVSTPWAYSRFRELNGNNYFKTEEDFDRRRDHLRNSNWLKELLPGSSLKLRNDLQGVVVSQIYAVENALKLLSKLPGALSVAMSGSGPSCFALYSDFSEAKLALNQNKEEFRKAGLEAWCCSLLQSGVIVE